MKMIAPVPTTKSTVRMHEPPFQLAIINEPCKAYNSYAKLASAGGRLHA